MDIEKRLANLEQMVANIADNMSNRTIYVDADVESLRQRDSEIEKKLDDIIAKLEQGGK